MCDFELGLRKSVKNVFEGSILQGCFFHFCKSIWKTINVLDNIKNILTKNNIDNEVSNKEKIDEEVDKFESNDKSSEDSVYNQNKSN